MRTGISIMAKRYNDRFRYTDPMAASSVSRSTSYRLKRRVEETSMDTAAAVNEERPLFEEYSCDLEEDLAEDLEEDLTHSSDFGISSELRTIFPDEPVLNEYWDEEIDSEDSEDEFLDMTANNTDSNVQPVPEVPMEGEPPLFPGCPLTSTSSNLLLLQFKMRHNLTQEALANLLQLLRMHCPSPNHCVSSVYKFSKRFDQLHCQLSFHYFCSTCLQELAGDEVNQCPNPQCARDLRDRDGKSAFIEVPLDLQLKTLLERSGVYQTVCDCYNLRCGRGGDRGDICDGAVYQELVHSGFLANMCNISLIFNTDGIPVFKSSAFAFWPLYLFINELPYKMRIKKENRLFTGLWYGSNKPDMTLFLKPLSQSLVRLETHGIAVAPPHCDPFTCHATLLACTCDLPARAIVMNCVQYNGFYGCSRCLQKGETVKTGVRGRVHVFPYITDDPVGPQRSKEQLLATARTVTAKPVDGVKGPSWLSTIPSFDIIRGMSFDYMHCVLLVTCRVLLRLWFTSQYHTEVWYIGQSVKDVDDRLCSIQPPNEIQRTPRCIENTVKFWKAHELRTWLLHYSPIVLHGILMDAYYQHHLLLIEGVYLLLKDVVKKQDIEQSSRLLRHYCFLVPTMYGERYMTASMHGLMHLPEAVNDLGPLWCHSCFPFEAANGEVLKWFHGSQAVEKQVVKHIGTLQRLPELAKTLLPAGSEEMAFYTQMYNKGKSSRCIRKVADGKYAMGRPLAVSITDPLKELFLQAGITLPSHCTLLTYSKLLLKESNVVITTDKKETRRNNSCVLYHGRTGTNLYGLLKNILLLDDGILQAFVIVVRLNPAGVKLCHDDVTNAAIDSHIVTCFIPRKEDDCVIRVENIHEKCLYMAQSNYVYVSHLPNFKEVD